MSFEQTWDVVIIGTGAGGGTLAHALASTGKRILLLERGDFLPREAQNWSTKSVVGEGRYKTKEVWLDKDGHDVHPHTHYWVGGNTKVYGAVLARMRERDFGEVEHFDGTSPAWPVSYADFEPHYTAAERLYHVHGERGADPTEPPASAPYPHPPVSHEPPIQQLFDAMKAAGHKPFALPVGIQLDEQAPQKSQCVRCGTCDGFPCLVKGKSDAHVICVEPALLHDNVQLITGAKVLKLDTDASGKSVTDVIFEKGGARRSVRGRIVVVSAGAINSAALLLKSANDQHPKGLANGSDQVGRNYMCHLNTAFAAVTTRKNPTLFQKTMGLSEFYFGDGEGGDKPLGHIQMLGKSDGVIVQQGAPPLTPLFVADAVAKHVFDFWLTSEDLPRADNRVTVEANGQIRLSYTPNNLEAHARLKQKLQQIVKKALPLGFNVSERIGVQATAHQCGTLRFGTDPKTSVLDTNCKAHELDNLYVVDASFFPSSSAVNPALTIIANALRVAEHLKARLS